MRTKKNILKIMGGLASILLLFLTFSSLSAANAAPLNGAISNLTVTPSNPDQNKSFLVNFDWSVADTAQPGDTFTLTLPAEISAVASDFSLKDAAGDVVATASVENTQVVFTLTDYKKSYNQVRGTVKLPVKFNKAMTTGQPVELVFGDAGKVTVTPTGTTTVDRTQPRKVAEWVNADGTASSKPTGLIRWTIESPYFVPATFTENVIFTDTSGPGQTIDCSSFTYLESTNLNPGSTSTSEPFAPPAEGSSSNLLMMQAADATPMTTKDVAATSTLTACAPGSFKANMKKPADGEIVIISYVTKVTDATLTSYTNSVDITIADAINTVAGTFDATKASGTATSVAIVTPTVTPTDTTTPPVDPTTTPAVVPPVVTTPPVVTPTESATAVPVSQEKLAATGANGTVIAGLIAAALLVGGIILSLATRRKRQH